MPKIHYLNTVTGRGHVTGASVPKLELFLEMIPDRVRILRPQITVHPHNRSTLTFDYEYGPRWDAFEFRVRRILRDAAKRAGTSPQITLTNLQRTEHERRPPRNPRLET